MTHAFSIITDDAEEYYDRFRHRIVDIAVTHPEGVMQFIGNGETLGIVYRDDDVTVVWSGGLTCVTVPTSGPSLTMRLVDGDEDLDDLLDRMTLEADWILQEAAMGYRFALAAKLGQGY